MGEVNRLMEGYNFGEAGRQIQEFVWNDFADWYVELAKGQLDGDDASRATTRSILYAVLEGSLRLLHPIMPFVTEEAWQYLTAAVGRGDDNGQHSIMIAFYPVAQPELVSDAAEVDFGLVQELIRGIRNVRNEYGVEPGRPIAATIAGAGRAALFREQSAMICRMARVAADQLTVVEVVTERPQQVATLVIEGVEVFLPLAGMIDLSAERERLAKELRSAEDDAARREAKLGNESFVARAPAAVVQRERDGLVTAKATADRLREQIAALG